MLRAAAATALLAVWCMPAASAGASLPDCAVQPGGAERAAPWAQQRLDFQRVWPLTKGAGVTVAVIDSGVNTDQQQMRRIRYAPGVNVVDPGSPTDTRDCVRQGHGTAVAAIIAAPKIDGVLFTGVAPEATILPIKQSDADGRGTADGIALGITAAIDRGATVVNISVSVTLDAPSLRAAAVAAEKADVVIVAAASNDGEQSDRVAYPAAYPTVLAVSATDQQDRVSTFSESGNYIKLAAPGDGIESAAPLSGYVSNLRGTSYAAPFVSGAAALVRAAHPELSAAQVRSRLELTADPPGVRVPDLHYGYGIVNPYLAVTSARLDTAPTPTPTRGAAFAAPTPAPPADRSRQHRAVAVGTGLLGVAVLALLTAGVLRRRV